MGDHAHRPVPDLPARWLKQYSIARLSSPSITTYTSMAKVQEQNSTIYEMGSKNVNLLLGVFAESNIGTNAPELILFSSRTVPEPGPHFRAGAICCQLATKSGT